MFMFVLKEVGREHMYLLRGSRNGEGEREKKERERAFFVVKGGGGLGPEDNNNVKSEKPTKR